jgi:hypothetical protein
MDGRSEVDELRLLEGLVTSRCGTTKSMAHFTFLEVGDFALSGVTSDFLIEACQKGRDL